MFEVSNFIIYVGCIFQVLDALVSLFCRSNISAETLWDGGWLLRQLLPYSEVEFNQNHLEMLRVSTYEATFGTTPTQKLIHAWFTYYCMLFAIVGIPTLYLEYRSKFQVGLTNCSWVSFFVLYCSSIYMTCKKKKIRVMSVC